VDITSYLGSAGERLWYAPSTPTRLTDTREVGACPPGQACTPGALPAFTKQFVPTVSNDARVVNLTVVDSRAPAWLQVGRCTDVGPEGKFSNLNVGDPGARANMALVPAGARHGARQARPTCRRRVGALSPAPGSAALAAARQCSTPWCTVNG
jgi:hypothetical protein